MNKLMNTRRRNWIVAAAIAGVLTFATTYVPMLSAVAYACGHSGGGC